MTWQDAQPDLPQGWAWTTVGEVADADLGKMLDRKKQTGEHAMKYLRNINIRWHSVELDDLLTMDVAPETRERYTVRAGDLVVCEGGEPGRCSVVPQSADGLAFQKALHRLRPVEGVDVGYLAYAFEAMAALGHLSEHLTGSTIKHLPRERLVGLPLPLPPSAEQRRIASLLDEQLARVVRAGSDVLLLRKMFEALDVTVLERGAQGYLTGNGPGDTPARIEGVEASVKFDYGSLPHLPDGWKWMRASDVCSAVFNGNTPKAEDMTPGRGDVPFFKVYNIDKRDGLDFSVRPTYVSRTTHEGVLKRSQLHPGDVMINIVGPPMGKVAIVPRRFPEANMNQAIVAFRPGPGVDARFLALALRAPFVLDRLTATSKATAGQFNISLTACRELPIPVPPRNEQLAIAGVAGDYFRARRPALDDLHDLSGRLLALRKSLLRDALTGRLLPQDPIDEPADWLLKQIAEEREARAAVSGARKRAVRKTRAGRASETKETSE